MVSEQELINRLSEAFPEAVVATEVPTRRTVFITIKPPFVRDVSNYLFEQGARFITSVATDYIARSDKLEVNHLFSLDNEGLTAVVKVQTSPANPTLDSISPTIPGANWSEREAYDMMGIDFIGHPDPRRLVMADDWPKGVFPLRRSFAYNEKPAPAPENAVLLKTPEPPSSVIPFGPFYPVLEEPVYIRVFVEGEQIIGCDYRGFYSHRGIEKLADSVLTYQQVPFIAERICGI